MGRALRRALYGLRRGLRPETCKDCWSANGIDFHVPDDVWSAVIGPHRWRVPGLGTVTSPSLCLDCFDSRARRAAVIYGDRITVFGCRSWMGGDCHDT
jgi:hypothetical protein